MGKETSIGWTHHTLNFWWGCNKVSAECKHCYIDAIMRRGGLQPFNGPIRTKGGWTDADRLDRAARKAGERRRVFTCSMSDFFHPGADQWRAEAWDVIKRCQDLDWLILTKRPELIAERLPADWRDGYPNVWLGVTVGCAESLYRLPHLEAVPAQVKWISAEPLLERMDFTPYLSWLDWIITGCEQAAKGERALMDIDWVRDIDRQCKAAGVAHFFKQAYIDDKGKPVEKPLLDGKIVQELPRSRVLC